MKLVDMKNTPREIKEDKGEVGPATGAYVPDKYPYGTRVTIEDDQLDGFDLSGIAMGTTVSMQAICKVVEFSIRERSDGKVRKRLELQITKMGLEPDAKEVKDGKKGERLNLLGGATN